MKSVNGRWGEIWFYEKDTYVGQSLENYGEYSPDETETILSLADKNKLCLDIGANFGAISQALESSGFNCVSFEPQPDIFNILCKNIKGQKFNCALGDIEGTTKIPIINPNEAINYGGISVGYYSLLGAIDVQIKTLDSFNFENVGFIKIDVEGYEEKVLRGAEKLIEKCRPILYVEDNKEGPSHNPNLRSYILSLDYVLEEHNTFLYRENNFFGLKENIWGKPFASFNLICKPL